ncbi:MAG: S8 family serine peptidase, partial [Candidatus Diapherotrites archaeon]
CSVCEAEFKHTYNTQGNYTIKIKANTEQETKEQTKQIEIKNEQGELEPQICPPYESITNNINEPNETQNRFLVLYKDQKSTIKEKSEIDRFRFKDLEDFITDEEPNDKEKLIIELKTEPILKKIQELNLSQKLINLEISAQDIENIKRIANEQYRIISTEQEMAIPIILGKFDSTEIIARFNKTFNGIGIKVKAKDIKKTINELERTGIVKKVYLSKKVQATLNESIPQIGVDKVWELKDSQGRNLTGEGITIAIIDTGVDYTHRDLGGCLGPQCKVIGGYDFVNNDNDPMDDYGHGTHVAAIAAGNGTLKGVAPNAKIIAYKVLDMRGSGNDITIIRAIEKAVDPNNDNDFSDRADILNLSLGGPGDPDDPLSTAIDNAVRNGSIAVIAADNRRKLQTISSPGTARKAITVGAIDKQGERSYFSSGGPTFSENSLIMKPEILAPGSDICAAKANSLQAEDMLCLDNSHVRFSGTSMAAPHVAGAIALIKQAHPDWNYEKIKGAIVGTAQPTGEDFEKIFYEGSGIVNPQKAINATIIANPPIIGILLKNENQIKQNISLKNISNTQKGVIIKKPEKIRFMKYRMESILDNELIISITEERLCITPDSERNTEIEIMNLEKIGYYSGTIKAEIFDNCEYNNKIDEIRIPLGIGKLNKVIIEVNPKEREEQIVRVVTFYKIDSDGKFMYDEEKFIENPKTIHYLEEGEYLIQYSIFNIEKRMFIADYFKLINIQDDYTLNINENTDFKQITTNGTQKMAEMGLRKYERNILFRLEGNPYYGLNHTFNYYAACPTKIDVEPEYYIGGDVGQRVEIKVIEIGKEEGKDLENSKNFMILKGITKDLRNPIIEYDTTTLNKIEIKRNEFLKNPRASYEKYYYFCYLDKDTAAFAPFYKTIQDRNYYINRTLPKEDYFCEGFIEVDRDQDIKRHYDEFDYIINNNTNNKIDFFKPPIILNIEEYMGLYLIPSITSSSHKQNLTGGRISVKDKIYKGNLSVEKPNGEKHEFIIEDIFWTIKCSVNSNDSWVKNIGECVEGPHRITWTLDNFINSEGRVSVIANWSRNNGWTIQNNG